MMMDDAPAVCVCVGGGARMDAYMHAHTTPHVPPSQQQQQQQAPECLLTH